MQIIVKIILLLLIKVNYNFKIDNENLHFSYNSGSNIVALSKQKLENKNYQLIHNPINIFNRANFTNTTIGSMEVSKNNIYDQQYESSLYVDNYLFTNYLKKELKHNQFIDLYTDEILTNENLNLTYNKFNLDINQVQNKIDVLIFRKNEYIFNFNNICLNDKYYEEAFIFNVNYELFVKDMLNNINEIGFVFNNVEYKFNSTTMNKLNPITSKNYKILKSEGNKCDIILGKEFFRIFDYRFGYLKVNDKLVFAGGLKMGIDTGKEAKANGVTILIVFIVVTVIIVALILFFLLKEMFSNKNNSSNNLNEVGDDNYKKVQNIENN